MAHLSIMVFVTLDLFLETLQWSVSICRQFLECRVCAEHRGRSWGKAAVNKTDKVPGGEAYLNGKHNM